MCVHRHVLARLVLVVLRRQECDDVRVLGGQVLKRRVRLAREGEGARRVRGSSGGSLARALKLAHVRHEDPDRGMEETLTGCARVGWAGPRNKVFLKLETK